MSESVYVVKTTPAKSKKYPNLFVFSTSKAFTDFDKMCEYVKEKGFEFLGTPFMENVTSDWTWGTSSLDGPIAKINVDKMELVT